MKFLAAALLLFVSLSSSSSFAQEAVTAATDPDKLFTSADPKLHANKQVVYHIVRDLLESHNWNLADRYLSEDYIQHNPNAASGRVAVVKYFTEVLKRKPSPLTQKLQKTKVVSVVAEDDLVVVSFVRDVKDKSGKPYTTTWFDMWRVNDGKATQHWDPATKAE